MTTSMILMLCAMLSTASPAEAQPVAEGELCPLTGVLLPTYQAAELAAGYDACRQSLVVERQHSAAQAQVYMDTLDKLDENCTEALGKATAPAWWTSGWTWAIVSAAVVVGFGIGYKFSH